VPPLPRRREQPARQRRERAGDVVVLPLVHLPRRDLLVRRVRRRLHGRGDELLGRARERVELRDERVRLVGVGEGHGAGVGGGEGGSWVGVRARVRGRGEGPGKLERRAGDGGGAGGETGRKRVMVQARPEARSEQNWARQSEDASRWEKSKDMESARDD
jgi:hypothetical protein